MITQTIDAATVSIDHEGTDYESRQRYVYVITTAEWQYVGNDISSGAGAAVDESDMLRSLFSFLSACAESRDYAERHGMAYTDTDNSTLFPDHVGEWTQSVSDELSMLSMDDYEGSEY